MQGKGAYPLPWRATTRLPTRRRTTHRSRMDRTPPEPPQPQGWRRQDRPTTSKPSLSETRRKEGRPPPRLHPPWGGPEWRRTTTGEHQAPLPQKYPQDPVSEGNGSAEDQPAREGGRPRTATRQANRPTRSHRPGHAKPSPHNPTHSTSFHLTQHHPLAPTVHTERRQLSLVMIHAKLTPP